MSRPNHPAAPIWTPDSARVHCERCELRFLLFRRRHHCRACGALTCGECSSYFRILAQYGYGDLPVRVCYFCVRKGKAAIELEVKAFNFAEKIIRTCSSRQKMLKYDKQSSIYHIVSCNEFSSIIATLLKAKGDSYCSKSFIQYLSGALEMLIVHSIHAVIVDGKRVLEQIHQLSPLTRISQFSNDKGYSQISWTLKKILERKQDIFLALQNEELVDINEQILTNVSNEQLAFIQKLEESAEKYFEIDCARSTQKRFLVKCKGFLNDSNLQDVIPRQINLDDIDVIIESDLIIDTFDTDTPELALKAFVDHWRFVKASPHVTKEVKDIGKKTLSLLMLSNYKSNFETLRRCRENVDLSLLMSALSQAFRIEQIRKEFSESHSIPSESYLNLLSEMKKKAEYSVKEFEAHDQDKVKFILEHWPSCVKLDDDE